MSQNDTTHGHHATLLDDLVEFYRNYYLEAIGRLCEHYPQEQRALTIDHNLLWRFDPDIATDCLREPETLVDHLEEALVQFDKPVDVPLDGAHVRVTNLPDEYTLYPGDLSPSGHVGTMRSVRGEIAKATDVYSRLVEGVFVCQRCGTDITIPQAVGTFEEPYNCQQCDRKGPFEIDQEQSTFVDAQKLRVQTPPEEAQGEGQDIDVFVEDDLADRVTVGDRVTITGTVELEQQGHGAKATDKFEPYILAHGLEVEETDAEEVDVTSDKRDHIEKLAAGEYGDPLAIAAETLAPKIYGNDEVKQAIVLALVGGAKKAYKSGDTDRGEFHVLLIGDPSTGKSKLVDRAEQVGWRAVGVSGSNTTKAGVTTVATQDDFGDGSWTVEAGAAVKAHRGILAIDELDDMPAEARAALLEPMSKQSIHVSKGGINTHIRTETAVVAAANPEQGRFDPYEPPSQQFSFTSTLLSRFDLVFTFTDQPDEDHDRTIAGHILTTQDAAKRHERGLPVDLDDADTDPRAPIDDETLRAWIALAKRQPKPVFADADVKQQIEDDYARFRGLYDYDPDEPVPVTARKLEGIVRVAEAAAKLEFSETIEARHVEIATELVGKSMRDIGKDEDGKFDADVKETGASQSQKARKEAVRETIQELQRQYDDGVPIEEVLDALDDYDADRIEREIETMRHEDGSIVQRPSGGIRWIGRH